MEDQIFREQLENLKKRVKACKKEEDWIALEKSIKEFVFNQDVPADMRSYARLRLWEPCGMMIESYRLIKKQRAKED